MPVDKITPGEAFVVDLSVTATGSSTAPNFSSTMVTYVLDGPSARYTFRWRPAGSSDSNFSLAGGVLTFTLSPSWTASYMASRGQWILYALVGDSTSGQVEVGRIHMTADPPVRGTLPVGG